MVFNSLTFIVFFLVVLALYRLLPSWSAKKVMLLVASYIFYGGWNPPFVLLLLLQTVALRCELLHAAPGSDLPHKDGRHGRRGRRGADGIGATG